MANLLLKYVAFLYKEFTNVAPEKNDRANTPDVLHSVSISIILCGLFIISHVRSCTFFSKLGFSLCCTKLDIYKLTL